MRNKLIETLVEEGYLRTRPVIEAFLAVDRADFVPAEFAEHAYANAPLPIGYEQTISQPLTVAFMLELLAPKPGDRVLDVGAGSGWQTALLAHIVSPRDGGRPEEPLVVAVERVPELARMAEENVAKYGFVEKGIATVIEGDGARGANEFGSFDRIIAAATAEQIPAAWREGLKVGGRIVAPVGESVVVIEKTGADEFEEARYYGFHFVPLVTK